MAIVNLVTALSCEARPFIDHYHLKKNHTIHQFNVFHNQHKSINLIISGIGNIKAATATCFLHMLTQDLGSSCYLNIGICGGAEKLGQLGECFLIHKIIDNYTNRAWYPASYLLSSSLSSASLISYARPEQRYLEDSLSDMEASGFFEAANLLVSQEQIQVLKIISDQKSEQQSISPQHAQHLIQNNLDNIIPVITQLTKLFEDPIPSKKSDTLFNKVIANWYFSQYQRHQLMNLYRRWKIILPEKNLLLAVQSCSSAQHVLKAMHEHLQEAHYTW